MCSWTETHIAVIASLAGSATSAYFGESTNWKEKVISFMMGAIAARFLGGPVDDFIHLGQGFTGYLMGFFGLNICVAVQKMIRRFGDNADLFSLLRDFAMRALDKFDFLSKTVEPNQDKE